MSGKYNFIDRLLHFIYFDNCNDTDKLSFILIS